jgi:hypothetical protein
MLGPFRRRENEFGLEALQARKRIKKDEEQPKNKTTTTAVHSFHSQL